MNKENLLDKYPGIKPKNEDGKFYEIAGDILLITKSGKIELIKGGTVWRCKMGDKVWFTLQIRSRILIDKGVSL